MSMSLERDSQLSGLPLNKPPYKKLLVCPLHFVVGVAHLLLSKRVFTLTMLVSKQVYKEKIRNSNTLNFPHIKETPSIQV